MFRVLDSLEGKWNTPEDFCYVITSKCENEMLHTYIERCASDKLAAINQMHSLDCNLQEQHFVRIQAAARGVKSSSFSWDVTHSLSVISNF